MAATEGGAKMAESNGEIKDKAKDRDDSDVGSARATGGVEIDGKSGGSESQGKSESGDSAKPTQDETDGETPKSNRERLRQSLTMYLEELLKEDPEGPAAELAQKEGADDKIVTEILEKIKRDFGHKDDGKSDAITPTKAPEENPDAVKCELCNLTLRNRDLYDYHINGQKHKKRLKRFMTTGSAEPSKDLFRCKECDIEYKVEDEYKKHLKTERHRKKEAATRKAEKEKRDKARAEGMKTNLARAKTPFQSLKKKMGFFSRNYLKFQNRTAKPTADRTNDAKGKRESPRVSPSRTQRTEPRKLSVTKGRKEDTCFECGKAGHFARECPSAVRCFTCNKAGHFSRECPSKSAETLRVKNVFYCDVCHIYLDTKMQLNSHCNSRLHQDRLRESERSQLRSPVKRRAEFVRDDAKRTRFWCGQCQVTFNSTTRFNDHLRSKRHHDMMEFERVGMRERSGESSGRGRSSRDIPVWENEAFPRSLEAGSEIDKPYYGRSEDDSFMNDRPRGSDYNLNSDFRRKSLGNRLFDSSSRGSSLLSSGHDRFSSGMHSFMTPQEERAFFSLDDRAFGSNSYSSAGDRLFARDRERRHLQDRLSGMSSYPRRF